MDKVFTNLEHAAWLREQARLKRPYWYGCYYNECTETLLQKKAKQYPSHYKSGRMPRYRQDIANGQICGDCVNGAIKGAIWSELGTRKPVYGSHGCPDTNADGMFAKCKAWDMEWGEIGTIPDLIGVAVRFEGHVGVYVGNGEVVEWRGFAYGCVVTKLKDRKWTHWYKLPWTEYVTESAAPTQPEATFRILHKGLKKDNDVKTMQRALMTLGYNLGDWGADGDFGEQTETALKEFQAAHGLEVDGEYGPLSHAALKAAQSAKWVRIVNGNVNVRTAPKTDAMILGVAYDGEKLPYGGQTWSNGWHLVEYKGKNAWVSGKYAVVEE